MTTDITVYWDDQMLDHEPPKGLQIPLYTHCRGP